MISLNDYLYSGDTVLKIIQNYANDLREKSRETHNENDIKLLPAIAKSFIIYRVS